MSDRVRCTCRRCAIRKPDGPRSYHDDWHPFSARGNSRRISLLLEYVSRHLYRNRSDFAGLPPSHPPKAIFDPSIPQALRPRHLRARIKDRRKARDNNSPWQTALLIKLAQAAFFSGLLLISIGVLLLL